MKKNYDQLVEINNNLDWSYIPDHPYRILIIGGSESGKTIALLKLIKHQWTDIDKIYSYIKDPHKSRYQFLINVREKLVIENLKNPKAFIDYLQTIDDVYENLEDYNPTNKRIVLIVFDYVIAYMEFDNISFKSKHSFLNEFFDELDELNNLSQQNESTKERKINMHDKASELYIEFLEIYYYKYYELSGHKKNRVPIWP